MPATRKDTDYFRLPDLIWIFLLPFLIYVMVGSFCRPEWVPFDYLGPFGALARYLVNEQPYIVIFCMVFTIVVHIAEVLYAATLCRRKGLSTKALVKWCMSTSIFGITSLIHLLRFDPKQED